MRIRRKDITRRLRFFAAILVAALWSDVLRLETYRRAWTALTVFFDYRQDGNRTPFWIVFRRMRVCQRCALYYKPLGTCSSPLKEGARDMGCWCFMPEKAAILEADCWLRESGVEDAGWPESARRFSQR